MASQLDRANMPLSSRTMARAGGTGDPDQDLKLIAVNSLMQTDPATALPILQKVLANANNSEKVKERALFVLTQNRSADARKIVLDTARNGSNNGLQMKAIDFLGMMGGEEAHKDLVSLFSGSSDPKVKSEVLKSYMMSGSRAGGKDELWDLYRSAANNEDKKQILRAMAMTGDGSRVMEVAQTDKDPSVRSAAVKSLAMTGKRDDGEALEAIYKSDTNSDVRKAVLDALFINQDGKSMVELARAEKDPAQKLEIVRKMSMIQSAETKAYMLEVLK